ncbi:MAG: metallophosphoesterase family protein [Syntrophobacteraceae bacterium]
MTGSTAKNVVRVAAISDVHCKKDSKQGLRPVFDQIAGEADVLLVCGDITHLGLPEEACVFLEQAVPVLNKIPVLCVLGNHDFESGKQDALWEQLSGAGLIMMDGDSLQIYGVGFTGVKGFGGGFGRMAVHPWGEKVIKDFVKEADIEAEKLETGLSKLDIGPRIVVMHYAPIRATVAGEPPELFPFLGSSRLEDPLNRFAVTAVFHGHAHQGSFEGKTNANIPVYNVSVAVLKQRFPKRAPFFMLEVPVNNC